MGKFRDRQLELAARCELEHNDDVFLFSFCFGCATSLYTEIVSKNLAKFRVAHAIPKGIHLHSFRHCVATFLDALASERQKRARMGWSKAHMRRHYTDIV
ncbi:hypothetical protein [Ferrimicrobium sp.]|uniref:hypothetical protein n=1 Tax=Ferrimicrobium sp. TaxID=2926050 RepID=UPI00262F527A|nr:hypothetical protein [Ferrimicrobium sp.]